MKNKLLLLVLSYSCCFNLFAQERHSVKLLARSNGKVILLRWAPTDAQTWVNGNQQGYVLERYTITKGNELVKPPERKILSSSVFKPKPLAQWEADAARNDYTSIAAQAIYGSSFDVKTPAKNVGALDVINKVKEQDQRFSFALLVADLSFNTALLSGLAFKDSTAQQDEKYLYRLFIAPSKAKVKTDTALFYISLRDTTSSVPAQELRAQFNDRIMELHWARDVGQQEYSGFIIERSVNDKTHFQPVNKIPFVGFADPSQNHFQFVDSLPANDVLYHYRVKGLTPFGDLGPPSEIVSGMGFKPMKARAVINEASQTANASIILKWNVIGETVLIKGFQIERSSKEGDGYEFINKMMLPSSERSFSDSSPRGTNYYRIKALGQHGETSVSMPYLVQLADSIPPAPPTGLEINIDTLGVVKLAWKPNTEKDLVGYRIYRSNFKNSEYSQISNSVVVSSIYTDTISLKSLTSKIYYKIQAEDNRHNPSSLSQSVVVDKPDRIRPLAPSFKSVKAVVGGVSIEWTKSASDDVNNYMLLRRGKAIPTWDEVKTFSISDTLKYRDVPPDLNQEFYYSLVAVDKSGNRSMISNPVLGKALRDVQQKPIENISYNIDRTQKIIRLKWSYLDTVNKYLIYKSTNDSPLSLYQSLPGKSILFEDSGLVMSTRYVYRIKAVFNDRSESSFSEEIILSY
jgi:uncharacterized protein